jgi:DNA invertase Pin-like site-specific DNA recombinase
MSEKIRPHHLQRKAILYVRQSSPYQVLHNLESQKLQHAMQEHLRRLGWQEVEIIDEDLGRSAAGTAVRAGFERMVAQVCLGRVGAVAAREVSRFARNSREWQQLVEVCRVVDTVLIDQETVYAPRQSNDRLLLGLKGSLNEYEFDLLRQRSLEARREMAKRGELIVSAPVGYIKSEEPSLEKTPDRRVREAIELLFEKVVEIGSVRQTLLWFQEHGLQFPAHTSQSEVQWKRPSYGCFYRLLTNPVYGGVYAYGKSGPASACDDGILRPGYRRKPREQWLSFIPNAHEGYVSWERFEQIQHLIKNNLLGRELLGSARCGQALLAGLLRCRRCGHKLTVRYTGNRHDVLRYSCWRGFLDNGEPRCIAFGGVPADAAIGHEVLRVVQPVARQRSWPAKSKPKNAIRSWPPCSVTWRQPNTQPAVPKSSSMPQIPRIAWWPTSSNAARTRLCSRCGPCRNNSISTSGARSRSPRRVARSSSNWRPSSSRSGPMPMRAYASALFARSFMRSWWTLTMLPPKSCC